MTHTITTGPPPGQSGGACIAQYNHYMLNGSKSTSHNPGHHNPNHHNPNYHNPNHHNPNHAGYHHPNHQSSYHNPYHQPAYHHSPSNYHIMPYYQHPVHYGAPTWTPAAYPGYY